MRQTSTRKNPLERVLSLFADVRAGEGRPVIVLMFTLFTILFAYYVIKTVREPLIFATGGAELKAYASGIQSLVLVFAVPVYGYIASRIARMKLIVSVFSFYCFTIFVFYGLAYLEVPKLGLVFYIWVGIFNISAVSQFQSFMNDIYSKEDGERLFPVVGIGASLGSILGSKGAEWLFEIEFGAYNMLLIAVGVLVLHTSLYFFVGRKPKSDPRKQNDKDEKAESDNGFVLISKSRYLRYFAFIIIVLNIVNTSGEYLLGAELEKRTAERFALMESRAAGSPGAREIVESGFESFQSREIGSFYGNYYFWVNIISLLLQAFVASRLIRYTGFRGALVLLPGIAFGVYGLIASGVSFATMRWSKTAENSTDYSIMNTAKAMAWLPLTPAQKYNAKQAMDTFFTRFGDVVAAGFVYLYTDVLGVSIEGFALSNLLLVVFWLLAAWRMSGIYAELASDTV